MAIVKMSKFNLIAFESQKSKLLKNLQKFREVSFIDIALEEDVNTNEEKIVKKVVNNEDLTRIDERLNGVENAISLVRKYHVSKKGLKAMMAGNDNYTFEELSKKIETYDWKKTYLDLKKLGAKLNQLNSEISKKYTEIEHIKNVVDKDIKGNFSEAIQKNITRENERWKKLSNNNIDFETVFQNNETIYY